MTLAAPNINRAVTAGLTLDKLRIPRRGPSGKVSACAASKVAVLALVEPEGLFAQER